MYFWRLKKVLEVEDDVNDLHVCFDRKIVNSIISKIRKLKGAIEMSSNNFPIGNPKHLDVGLEKHSENYKEEIIEFKTLKIKIDDSINEIFVSFIDDIAKIELSEINLIKLLQAIKYSKKCAYIYDNFLDAKRKINESSSVKSKIIFWAGMDGDIFYC